MTIANLPSAHPLSASDLNEIIDQVNLNIGDNTGVDAIDTLANLTALPRSEGKIYYATDTDLLYSDDGTSLNVVSGVASAGGSDTQVQFNDGGSFSGTPEFSWNNTTKDLELNGLKIRGLAGPLTLMDNTIAKTVIISRNAATHKYMAIEYSIERNGICRTGTLHITNNGMAVGVSDSYAETSETGIILSAALSGGGSMIDVEYTASATTFNGSFKYSIRYWN